MRSILIACLSQRSAQLALSVASDLSVACGASLSLLIGTGGQHLCAANGLEAVGMLSDVLFAPYRQSPVTTFPSGRVAGWIADLGHSVDHHREAPCSRMPLEVESSHPDLVITADRQLAQELVELTTVPVWYVRPKRSRRAWFTIRKVRCAVLGTRATGWAGVFAAGLGAQLETVSPGLLGNPGADLLIVDRERRVPALQAWTAQPVVVV